MEADIGVGTEGPLRSNLCFALGHRYRRVPEVIERPQSRSSDEHAYQPKSVAPPDLIATAVRKGSDGFQQIEGQHVRWIKTMVSSEKIPTVGENPMWWVIKLLEARYSYTPCMTLHLPSIIFAVGGFSMWQTIRLLRD
jgi:hypothetical protein